MIYKVILIILVVFTFIESKHIKTKGADMDEKVFRCKGAGKWFPYNRDELELLISNFFKNSTKINTTNTPLGLIAPHAGYVYSGLGQAYSYKSLADKNIENVIILGPSHYFGFDKISVLKGYSKYSTPLGDVEINKDIAGKLLSEQEFDYYEEAHLKEHSVENQIPFIQHVLPKAKIVPCVVGQISISTIKKAGTKLSNIIDEKTILAVSSDFTHYGSAFGYVPFSDNIRKSLEDLDRGAIDYIKKCDLEGFNDYLSKTNATICGRYPIMIMMQALQNKKCKGKLLNYYTSSDQTNDFSHAVCYASIIMVKENE